MKPGQMGFTSCLAAIGLQAMCSQFIDPAGGTNGFPNTQFTGYVSVSGATPTMSGSTVGFGNTTGFGNGAAGTAGFPDRQQLFEASPSFLLVICVRFAGNRLDENRH